MARDPIEPRFSDLRRRIGVLREAVHALLEDERESAQRRAAEARGVGEQGGPASATADDEGSGPDSGVRG